MDVFLSEDLSRKAVTRAGAAAPIRADGYGSGIRK
jgi:hypothetical protein